MDWVLELVSEVGFWGSLALLTWGGALGLKEAFARSGDKAEGTGPSASGAALAHAGEH
jgi:hypothetical protein